jgi:F-type H+-transporting ATPase subunit b
MIAQRRAAAQQALAEAEAKRGAAVAALADIELVRAGFAKERDAILAAAHAAAEAARTACLDEAAKEVAAREAAARTALQQEKEAADREWAERASRLAVEIAGRLAARLDGPAVQAAFLDWLLAEIRGLPEPTRQAMAANGSALEAISAAAIEPADQDRYRELIGTAFGAHPQIAFTVDPALIAGLELRGPHLVIGNSWRADLAQILTGLAHDG